MLNNRAGAKNRPVVLITGASGGLGRETALAFARAGYRVAVHYRQNRQRALRVVSAIRRSGGDAHAFGADVGKSSDVARMFEEFSQHFPRLDVLIHSAGNTDPALILRMRPDQFDGVVRTHLTGGFLCTRAAARIMRRRKSGAILYIGSILGARGVAGECNYAAAKAGLTALAKSAARELGRYNISVNVVLPGYMMTSMGRETSGQIARLARQDNVFGQWTKPQDTARMILALCRSPWISGQVLNLDGRIL